MCREANIVHSIRLLGYRLEDPLVPRSMRTPVVTEVFQADHVLSVKPCFSVFDRINQHDFSAFIQAIVHALNRVESAEA